VAGAAGAACSAASEREAAEVDGRFAAAAEELLLLDAAALSEVLRSKEEGGGGPSVEEGAPREPCRGLGTTAAEAEGTGARSPTLPLRTGGGGGGTKNVLFALTLREALRWAMVSAACAGGALPLAAEGLSSAAQELRSASASAEAAEAWDCHMVL